MRKLINLFLVCFLLVSCSSCGKISGREVEIYYMNSEHNNIISEKVTLRTNDLKKAVEQILDKMMSQPKNPTYASVFPKGTEVRNVSVNDRTTTIDFSSEIYDLDTVTSVLMRGALVNSITSLNGIDGVKVTVNGESYVDKDGNKIGILNSSDIVLDAHGETVVRKYAKLYYASSDGLSLVPEVREIEISDKESAELLVVKELLKGPSANGVSKTIPSETKVLSVETKEGICLVNFSNDFITKHSGGAAAEALTIYSVVNSLTELEGVDKVQFLIEGQKRESFIHMIFNEPFTRNESYIQ